MNDIVNWSWMSPAGVSGVRYTVQQTDDIDSSVATHDGFGYIGPGTSHGNYSYQFSQEGVFYYWSGAVDPTGTQYTNRA